MVAEGPAMRMFDRMQQDMIEEDLGVMAHVVQAAIAAERLPPDTLELVDIQAVAPTLAVRDRLQDAQADQILVRNQAMSVETMAARHGLSPDHEQQLISRRADVREANFDPNEPRDRRGRWTTGDASVGPFAATNFGPDRSEVDEPSAMVPQTLPAKPGGPFGDIPQPLPYRPDPNKRPLAIPLPFVRHPGEPQDHVVKDVAFMQKASLVQKDMDAMIDKLKKSLAGKALYDLAEKGAKANGADGLTIKIEPPENLPPGQEAASDMIHGQIGIRDDLSDAKALESLLVELANMARAKEFTDLQTNGIRKLTRDQYIEAMAKLEFQSMQDAVRNWKAVAKDFGQDPSNCPTYGNPDDVLKLDFRTHFNRLARAHKGVYGSQWDAANNDGR